MTAVDFNARIARAIAERRAEAAARRSGIRSRWSLRAKPVAETLTFEPPLCYRHGAWFTEAA